MLQADVLTAYATCGAGSVVGAVMMQLVQTQEPRVRAALHWCTVGFVILAVALGSVTFVDPTPGSLAQALMAAGTLACLVVFREGLSMLMGSSPLPRPVLVALLLYAVLSGCAGLVLEARPFLIVFCVAFAVLASVMAASSLPFLLHPRDHTERAVAIAELALAASAWGRLVLAFTTPGEPAAHLLHAPQWLATPMAVFYGVLPSVVATLLLSSVNARLRRHLSQRASTDELTGALTRRALRELAPALIERERTAGHDVALMMLDLDHFKAINDRFGHASGDRVLQQTGALLREQLRGDALLARYGGEEFVAVVPVPDLPTARRVAERLRSVMPERSWLAADGRSMGVTLSVGVALVLGNEDLDAALQRADRALYRAKNEGRNQVQVEIAAA